MAWIFFITTIICGAGWLIKSVCAAALVHYIQKKGYTQPTNEEIAECTRYVAEKMLRRR